MEYGILEQIQMIFDSRYRLIKWCGTFITRWFPTIIGGLIPLQTFAFAHHGQHIKYYMVPVLGGLAYSALTVFKWMSLALNRRGSSKWETVFKALGFVVLTEMALIMGTGNVLFLSYIALGILIFINAVATGSSLILESKEKKEARENSEEKQKADMRQEILEQIKKEELERRVLRMKARNEAKNKRAVAERRAKQVVAQA